MTNKKRDSEQQQFDDEYIPNLKEVFGIALVIFAYLAVVDYITTLFSN